MSEERKRFIIKQLKKGISCNRELLTIDEIKEVIEQTLLKEHHRIMAEMRYIKGYDCEKIAELLGYDIRTIKKMLYEIISPRLCDTIKKIVMFD